MTRIHGVVPCDLGPSRGSRDIPLLQRMLLRGRSDVPQETEVPDAQMQGISGSVELSLLSSLRI